MEKASKEILREFVNRQHFTSTSEIMESMKELFSDVLQQVMEHCRTLDGSLSKLGYGIELPDHHVF